MNQKLATSFLWDLKSFPLILRYFNTDGRVNKERTLSEYKNMMKARNISMEIKVSDEE